MAPQLYTLMDLFRVTSTDSRLFILISIIGVLLTGCDQSGTQPVNTPPINSSEQFPGGDTSVSTRPFPSFQLPAKNLPVQDKPNFYAGKALANQPWIKAPTATTARDGLGPLYNARSCLGCHAKGGKGKLPESPEESLHSSFVRISLPGVDSTIGVIPEPTYGDQLQTQSVALSHQLRGKVFLDNADSSNTSSKKEGTSKTTRREVAPEAQVFIEWEHSEFQYPDEQTLSLRRPLIKISELAYGTLHPDAVMGLRNAPAIHGMGLLELIDQTDIKANADPEDENGDGISGRVNTVWDKRLQRAQPGRFGWKANRNSIEMVVAAAFANDIGITNPLFPNQPCSQGQTQCLTTTNGNDKDGVELPAHLLELTVNFVRNIGVPKRQNFSEAAVMQGRDYFYQSGCSNCHSPNFITTTSDNSPHLSQQSIWPYTDLLLHDMGVELADGRTDYDASGTEWRTAPLWGAGLNKSVNGSQYFLHDGRARTIEEAIIWHGGEAMQSRNQFTLLNQQQREALLSFVGSL